MNLWTTLPIFLVWIYSPGSRHFLFQDGSQLGLVLVVPHEIGSNRLHTTLPEEIATRCRVVHGSLDSLKPRYIDWNLFCTEGQLHRNDTDRLGDNITIFNLPTPSYTVSIYIEFIGINFPTIRISSDEHSNKKEMFEEYVRNCTNLREIQLYNFTFAVKEWILMPNLTTFANYRNYDWGPNEVKGMNIIDLKRHIWFETGNHSSDLDARNVIFWYNNTKVSFGFIGKPGELHIFKLDQKEKIFLSRLSFTDKMMSKMWENNLKLDVLMLADCKVDYTRIHETLTVIHLDNVEINGDIMMGLSKCKNLQELVIHDKGGHHQIIITELSKSIKTLRLEGCTIRFTRRNVETKIGDYWWNSYLELNMLELVNCQIGPIVQKHFANVFQIDKAHIEFDGNTKPTDCCDIFMRQFVQKSDREFHLREINFINFKRNKALIKCNEKLESLGIHLEHRKPRNEQYVTSFKIKRGQGGNSNDWTFHSGKYNRTGVDLESRASRGEGCQYVPVRAGWVKADPWTVQT